MNGFFMQAGVATLILNLLALIIGFIISRLLSLSKAQSITIAFEVGIQNGTLALFITGTILASAAMTIPVVTYCLIMLLTGSFFGCLGSLLGGEKKSLSNAK